MFVAFLDVLGSAAQVTHLSDDDCELIRRALENDAFEERLSPTAKHVFWTFLRFRESVRESVDHAMSIGEGVTETITFSDSAFVIGEDLNAVDSLVANVMLKCCINLIPIRGGIAAGGYFRWPFYQQLSTDQSLYGSYAFGGPAVVGSYRAESQGKGLRVFIHPSAVDGYESHMGSDAYRKAGGWPPILPLPDEEVSENATHELNLIRVVPFGEDWGEKYFLRAVESLKGDAPPRAKVHYRATELAINRMRAEVGFEPG